MFTEAEKNRYSRHIRLSEVGEAGQQKLKNAKVLVVGAGGLGCPILQYLAAAGVGTIGVIDFDKVDESNLQRQVLFTVEDIGKNKAEVAAQRLVQLNPLVDFKVYPTRLTTENALELFAQFDIIVDGSDNFSTRYLVNDAAIIAKKPLVYGSIYKFEGQVSVFNYIGGPSYRCLYPDPPASGDVPNCSEIGVIGVLPGIIGTYQANEAIKIILEIGEILSGELLIIDALNNNTMKLSVSRNYDAIEEVISNSSSFKETDYDLFCGIQPLEKEVDSVQLKREMATRSIAIIDVREPFEAPKYEELNAINIPLGIIDDADIPFSKDDEIVVYCQHGVRSRVAIEILKQRGFTKLINLKDGIVTW